jgi:DNA-binding MarR family transcriptional regulator
VQEPIGPLLRQVFTRFSAAAVRDGPQSREFVVLDALADQDAGSQQDLAHRLGINRTIMVKVLDQLQAEGYVTRTRNPANRRTYLLSLTGDGRKALEGMREAVADRDAEITAGLTDAERDRLRDLLTRLLPDPEPGAVHSIEHLVTQAHYRLRKMGDHLLAESGLRTRHFMLLPTLARLAPCPQLHLARELRLTEPATASLVEELVQAGLVVRGQDPHDRRRYALELTDLGSARLPDVQAARDQLGAEVLALLGEDGVRDLSALLIRLLESGEGGTDGLC